MVNEMPSLVLWASAHSSHRIIFTDGSCIILHRASPEVWEVLEKIYCMEMAVVGMIVINWIISFYENHLHI